MSNRTRNLLHRTKLDNFLSWAIGRGYTVSFPHHTYQAAVLNKGCESTIIYERDHGDHLTTYGMGTTLVEQWLNERKSAA